VAVHAVHGPPLVELDERVLLMCLETEADIEVQTDQGAYDNGAEAREPGARDLGDRAPLAFGDRAHDGDEPAVPTVRVILAQRRERADVAPRALPTVLPEQHGETVVHLAIAHDREVRGVLQQAEVGCDVGRVLSYRGLCQPRGL